MVKSKSTSRLSNIAPIILTQTDTTVGFVSQDANKLFSIKFRDSSKVFIVVYSSLTDFLNANNRVPLKRKNLVRRSKKTSFIIKNRAFRIAKTTLHSKILRNLKWNFSTSANESGKKFNLEFCEHKTDIIVEDKNGFHENPSSSLFKINNTKQVRLR